MNKISGQRMRSVTRNRYSLKIFADKFTYVAFVESLVTWMQISASLNHCKVKKTEPSRIILRKLAANLKLF